MSVKRYYGTAPLLEAKNIKHGFPVTGGRVVYAVSGVSFRLWEGETLGVVGESGSGKTTLARTILQMPRPDSGSVLFRGCDLTRLTGRRLLQVRREMQMVFQDPSGSLDPKWRVERIVAEPLIAASVASRAQRRYRVDQALELVGLSAATYGRRRPGELSGGQCQRVAIARALIMRPKLLICDEALSSLDALVQAQLVDLFRSLAARFGLTFFYISHDLSVVASISDRIAVMHLGRLCEIGDTQAVFREARHPYTTMLLACMEGRTSKKTTQPIVEDMAATLPSPLEPLTGCSFRNRCARAQHRCTVESPELRSVADNHLVACHFPISRNARSGALAERSAEAREQFS